VTVVWSPRAIGHLADLRTYIALENPDAAARTATILLAAADRLAALPNLGVPVGCLGLVSSWFQAHGTSFRTECAANVWRSSRCSMAASAGKTTGEKAKRPGFLGNLASLRIEVIGARGFEPPTPRSRTECVGDEFSMIPADFGVG